MTPRPIIFSAPMVRALIDGRKTMTRRLAWKVADRQPDIIAGGSHARISAIVRRPSPWQRVRPGDRLWTRETWCSLGKSVFFAADTPGQWRTDHHGEHIPWRSSIHMPRWASRLTLVVTATKIERLQAISEADARAEGCRGTLGANPDFPDEYDPAPEEEFADLWRSLHGPDSWAANPEVVAISFRVIRANIDSAEARAA